MSGTGDYSRINLDGREHEVDLSEPIALSHTISHGEENPNCFFAPDPEFQPLRSGDFVGSIEEGSPVNFYNVMINPHGSTTHTECVGHIQTGYHLKDCLDQQLFWAYLVTVDYDISEEGDKVIHRINGLKDIVGESKALILRLRNWSENGVRYSGTNPIFVNKVLISEINRVGVQHLLVEIPSIDREEDGGRLEAHREFWFPNGDLKKNKTITELIRVPDEVEDGPYLLNLQVLNIALDVSPSNPIIYKIKR